MKKNDKEEATDTAPPDRPKSPELPPPFPRYNLGPLPKLPPETKSGCTSRLFGILIVLGVILILFMIAVPNFLESQSRSKVSRAMADQRSLATGLEAYYVDYNSYPAWVEVLWQGPVKYLSQGPVDPFAGRGSLSSGDGQSLFHYVTGTDAFNRAKQAGLVNPYAEQPSSFWMTYSVGPSGQDSGGTIVYDPTNGTISAGNIIRISQGNLSGYGDSFSRLSYGGAYGGAAPAAKSASVSRAKMPAGESGSGYSMKATFPALGRQGAPEPPQGASAAGEAKTQDRLAFAYDPTNGTASEGDIYRTKDSVDYQTGRRLADGELLKSGRTAGPGKPETVVGSAGALFSEGYANAVLLNLSGENSFKDLEAIRRKEAAARQAGLLSMGIELPEGGTRKKLETLGEAKRIEIRLMDWKDYARLQFLVWIAAFLLLTWIWIARRAWFRSAFIAAIALSLLPPVLFDTPWAPLFNAAFQGVLLSLASPIIHFLIHRYGWFAPHAGNHGGDSQSGNSAASPSGRSPEGPGARGGAKAVIFIAAALSLGAPSTASTASTLSTPSTPSTNPVRILVPYDATELKLITLQETPSFLKRDLPAFLSRADFTRLWNAARRDQTEPARLQPLIAEMRLTGTLSPERSTIEGELTLLAINPANAPSSAVIGLEGMALTESTASAPGAALEEGAKTGLLLQMSANWSGAIVARFVLPCQTRGATGRMSLRFPDAGAGTWKIQIPYPDVTAKYGEAARAAAQTLCVSERTSGSTILTGAIKPGPFNLSWTARETGGGGAASARAGANEWRAVITQRVSWEDLSEARFFATISLSPSAAGKNLPAEVTLAHDSSLSVVSAKGEGLLSAEDAPADEPAGGPGARATSRLVLRLADVPSASIVLEGICRAPSGGRPWQALGVRAPQGIESRATLRLEIPDDIEIQSVQTRGLERRPTREAIPGCSVFIYESARGDGEATLALRRLEAAFDVETLDAFAPAGDLLWRAATIQLTPRSSQLRECVLEAPAGLRVLTLKGKDVAGWFQSGDRIFAAFHPPLEHPSALELTAIGETRASSDVLTLRPLAVQGASRTRGGAVIVVPAGAECGEIDIAKATPRPPTNVDGLLAAQACGVESAKSGSLRAYTLDSTAPLRLAFRTLEATSLDTVFNRLTVSDGLQSLECVVRSEPRRGRLNRIEALLVLPAPDPTAPARLQVSGPVRHLKTDPVGARAWRVTAELNAPYAHAVEVRFQLDRPLPPEEKSLVRSMAFLPVRGGGARAFLLLRRAFEGELKTAEAAGARSLDPSTPPWPGADFHPMPSDQAFELSTAANAIPTFAVTRHARSEALRAVAEALRQRVIVTDDGLERVELTIVLQNQSEQFLKIALPYPKERITIYETRVADRLVKTTFGMEAGREALLVPLIRPGALDPELTIRIAFTAKSGKPLHGSGAREERQAEVLGGVPVAHSSLVLMLPPDFQYSKFEGTLNRVEMVDLEIDEALRGAKKIERLTQIALYNPALVQHKTLQQLNAYQAGIEMNVKAARQINEAQKRMYRARETAQDQKESQREQELDKARAQTLEEAESAAKTSMFSNTRINQAFIAQNAQQPGAPAQPPSAAAVEPPPPAQPAVMAPIEFPRVGEVFVFRQLQGTGAVTFRYHSREAAGFRNDVFFALFLTLMAAIATYASRHLFANLRRAAILALILCITAILFRVALDVTIPAAALALLLLLLRRKRPAASK
ncbi:MAG: hypothetical protein NTX50_18570 [Candidatus Sumerlaeota bacterium]|nr:hypothetical protein [Candidatus Sumerlaeota bacterium]